MKKLYIFIALSSIMASATISIENQTSQSCVVVVSPEYVDDNGKDDPSVFSNPYATTIPSQQSTLVNASYFSCFPTKFLNSYTVYITCGSFAQFQYRFKRDIQVRLDDQGGKLRVGWRYTCNLNS